MQNSRQQNATTFVKIKSASKISVDTSITAILPNNKSDRYKFNNKGEVTFPIQ